MTHECHWKTLENIFVPREAMIVRATQPTESETHFTLRMTDGRPMAFQPGQILEVSLFGYGEIPIGFASSPTREHTFDLVIRTVGRVSTAINTLRRGQSLYVRGPIGRGFDLAAVARARRADHRRRHRPVPDAQPDPVHPRPAARVQALHRSSTAPATRSRCSSWTTWPAGGSRKTSSTTRRSTGRCPAGRETSASSRRSSSTRRSTPIPGSSSAGRRSCSGSSSPKLDRLGIPRDHVFVDLERRMKCGIGKCGHCQINDKYVCVDGPVFSLRRDREPRGGVLT